MRRSLEDHAGFRITRRNLPFLVLSPVGTITINLSLRGAIVATTPRKRLQKALRRVASGGLHFLHGGTIFKRTCRRRTLSPCLTRPSRWASTRVPNKAKPHSRLALAGLGLGQFHGHKPRRVIAGLAWLGRDMVAEQSLFGYPTRVMQVALKLIW